MSGASITQTLDWWSAELGAVKAQLGSLFSHASVAVSAAAFLDGLLGPERRKTGWMRAEAAGDFLVREIFAHQRRDFALAACQTRRG